MNNLFLFVIAILLIFLLIALSVFSTKAAINVFNSKQYNNQQKVRTAHQYLTIAASLSWSSLVTLLLISGVIIFAGLFSSDKETTISGKYVLLFLVIFLTIFIIITTALIIVATIDLGNVYSKDPPIDTAYKDGIIGSVLGAASIGGSLILGILFYSLYSKKENSKNPKKNNSIPEKEQKNE